MARAVIPGAEPTGGDTPAPARRRRRRAGTADAAGKGDTGAAAGRSRTVSAAEANAAADDFENGTGAAAFSEATEGAKSLTEYPRVEGGLMCSKCFEPQYESPHGPVCENGHGAADGLTPEDAKKAQRPKPPRSPFATAPHQARFPTPGDLKNGFNEITVKLFEDRYDPVAEWELISDALEIQGTLNPGNIQAAANKQEKIADRAFRLYIVARREYSAYMRETDPIVGAIREAAIAQLEIEKRTMVDVPDGETKGGEPKFKRVSLRSKMITDADVTGACAHHYADEWADVTDKREKAKAMVDQIENLAELARSRAATARSLISPRGRVAG